MAEGNSLAFSLLGCSSSLRHRPSFTSNGDPFQLSIDTVTSISLIACRSMVLLPEIVVQTRTQCLSEVLHLAQLARLQKLLERIAALAIEAGDLDIGLQPATPQSSRFLPAQTHTAFLQLRE